MKKDALIFVTGHKGLVGSALVRNLTKQGFTNILVTSRSELNLCNQVQVNKFFETHAPEYVFLAAGKVGGILGNKNNPAEFIYENLAIVTNIIHAAHLNKTTKLLFLGSSCIYPKFAEQPIVEEALLSSELEPTNEFYAIAKIAGIKMCEAYRKQYGDNFISVMPTNLYGPGDNYHPENSHVMPAMIRRFHEAKENNLPTVTIWGTGAPKREFLHVDDLADACVTLMKIYTEDKHINIGTGEDITIEELALTIQKIIGYRGEVIFDSSKPDGTPKKLLDVSKLHNLGWHHTIKLQEGITRTYASFLEELATGRLREV